MTNKQIFILDADQSQTEILLKLIVEDGYESRLFSSISDLSEEFSGNPSVLCLIDYPTLLQAQREDVIRLFQSMKVQETAVYNVPEDASRRLAFYELGARRVYDSGHSLEEIYYSLRWLLRIVTDQEMGQVKHSHGNLDDLPLLTLIPLLALEERSGILTVHSSKNSGKIYFSNGNIINAQTGPYVAEQAFYHMLLWTSGKFMFNANEEIKPENKILLSNFGLLIKGEQLKKEFDAHLQEIAPLSSVLRATRLGDLKLSKRKIKQGFLEYIKRPRTVEEIIENPFYTANETIEELVYLKSNGFLIINEPAEQVGFKDDEESESPEASKLNLSDKEFEALKLNLQLDDQDMAKIVILSADNASRSKFIEDIARSFKSGEGNENLEVGRVCINEKLNLYLIGLEMNQTAAESIDQIFGGLAGFVFMIDASRPEQFEYINYVMNQILTAKPLPAVVGVTNIPEHESVHSIRNSFVSPEQLTWIKKPDDSLHLLFSIYPFNVEEEQEEQENEEGNTEA